MLLRRGAQLLLCRSCRAQQVTAAGLEKTRVFLKKTQPSGFFWFFLGFLGFFGFFLGFFAQTRGFLGFFSVS